MPVAQVLVQGQAGLHSVRLSKTRQSKTSKIRQHSAAATMVSWGMPWQAAREDQCILEQFGTKERPLEGQC